MEVRHRGAVYSSDKYVWRARSAVLYIYRIRAAQQRISAPSGGCRAKQSRGASGHELALVVMKQKRQWGPPSRLHVSSVAPTPRYESIRSQAGTTSLDPRAPRQTKTMRLGNQNRNMAATTAGHARAQVNGGGERACCGQASPGTASTHPNNEARGLYTSLASFRAATMVGWDNTNLRQTINNREYRVVERCRGGGGENRSLRAEAAYKGEQSKVSIQ